MHGFADLTPEEQEQIARDYLGNKEYERRQANETLGVRFDPQSVRERLSLNPTGLP